MADGGWLSSYDHHVALVFQRRYNELSITNEGIHLGAYTNLAWDVDTWLDRERDPRHQQSLLACLEIVEVRAGAMEIAGVDRVARAVRESIAEACGRDHVARCVIRLTTPHRGA